MRRVDCCKCFCSQSRCIVSPFVYKVFLTVSCVKMTIQMCWVLTPPTHTPWVKISTIHQKVVTMRLYLHIILHLNPLTPKISLVILLTVCYTVLVMLVWRIWYWINLLSPNWYFSLFSSLVCLILYWYCEEIFCLGHSWELKG